jgi:hypothetical protein
MFRESALAHVDLVRRGETPEQLNSTHVFLSQKCIDLTKQASASGSVDVDASFLLASVVVLRKQDTKDFHAKKKDALRALAILEPVVQLVLAGQSATSLGFPNHVLALHVSQLLVHSARFVDATDAKHHCFQQAWECVGKCGDNLNRTDDNYEERRTIAVAALQSFASLAGEYVVKRVQGDQEVAAMVVKATEAAFALDPSPDNIAGMGNTYDHFAKDYVKAARWYRKALTLPEDVSNALFPDARAYWKHKTILAQLQLPGMPLDGVRIMNPVGAPPGPSGQPQTFHCAKIEGSFGDGPGGMQMMLSLNPPFQYTIPTTDPDDPDVFPPHVLEMVQPDLLDGEE